MNKPHEDKEHMVIRKVAVITCIILVVGFIVMSFAGILY